MDLVGILARVGERVQAYYQRAQSIVCIETLERRTLRQYSSPDPSSRRLVYELRVSWEQTAGGDGPSEANVIRTLKTVNGRVPKKGEEPKCDDPKPVDLDPLSFLLPQHQREYDFTYKGVGKAGNGRTGVMLEFAPAGKDPEEIAWDGDCFSFEIPQRTRGRVWVDRFTGDVLRFDDTVRGPLDIEIPLAQRTTGTDRIITFDRYESSTRYRTVTFKEPEEVVLLPESIETMMVFGSVRVHTIRTFAGYQRFVTGGRVIPE